MGVPLLQALASPVPEVCALGVSAAVPLAPARREALVEALAESEARALALGLVVGQALAVLMALGVPGLVGEAALLREGARGVAQAVLEALTALLLEAHADTEEVAQRYAVALAQEEAEGEREVLVLPQGDLVALGLREDCMERLGVGEGVASPLPVPFTMPVVEAEEDGHGEVVAALLAVARAALGVPGTSVREASPLAVPAAAEALALALALP